MLPTIIVYQGQRYQRADYSFTEKDVHALAQQALTKFGADAVILDGDDDWYAPRLAHPREIAKVAGITILGDFHSGISGISKSGIVIKAKDLAKFKRTFKQLAADPEWTGHRRPNIRGAQGGPPRDSRINIITKDGMQPALMARGSGVLLDGTEIAILANKFHFAVEDFQREDEQTRVVLTARAGAAEAEANLTQLVAALSKRTTVVHHESLAQGQAVIVLKGRYYRRD